MYEFILIIIRTLANRTHFHWQLAKKCRIQEKMFCTYPSRGNLNATLKRFLRKTTSNFLFIIKNIKNK